MLDWPFLFFVVLVVLIFMTKEQLKGLINRSNLKITWGDRSIELNELADNVDQDLDPIKERLDLLEEQLKSMGYAESNEPEEEVKQPTPAEVEKVVNVALKNPKYKYRTVNGIAKEAKIPKVTAQKILGTNPNVRVIKARDGRELYATSNKPGQQDK
ncbi:hypothetical protein LZ24_03420 [Desulfobotulus alkaliphilus]|uniref:Uncharacterized protein n=2 Tax=Desulfobotulus alkaliphilus TaxID=622671 RepID=A0A562QY65_9BACT|nr:hypothetical protein LZ24_03420 [Desulfobotulus alkaliphilus]